MLPSRAFDGKAIHMGAGQQARSLSSQPGQKADLDVRAALAVRWCTRDRGSERPPIALHPGAPPLCIGRLD
jgi:hypothetical protein